MSGNEPKKQPVTLETMVISAVLVFVALRFAAGFETLPSVAVGLAVGAIAFVLRRRMMSDR